MHTILIAGAALVGLPILLHLIMKQEPKRLTFPAFRFLTQKLKTNQRKLRLRHFILLAMRMLLIALFCLTLYQPTLLSERFGISGDQPVAVVVVIDTSPSMGYTPNDKSRFEEARRRALELLDTLPDKSVVAVVETDNVTVWRWTDIAEARKQLERLDKPRGGNQPVTTALMEAYRSLTKIEGTDAEDADKFPKLVAVFTDRTAASWNPDVVGDLKKLRDAVPDPKPTHTVFDVGADHPTNIAILSAKMKPQVIAANQPAVVIVTVAATGPATEPPVEVTVQGEIAGTKPQTQTAKIPYGQSRPFTFRFEKLKPGMQQVVFKLVSNDPLTFDNTRSLTFKVGAARRVLTIADNPDDALFWQWGVDSKGEFSCLVVSPDDVKTGDNGRTEVWYPNPEKPDEILKDNIREFEAVCLLSVRDPSQPAGNPLWDKLKPYVVDFGGKLVVIPGDERLSVTGYAAAKDWLPGTFTKVLSTSELDPPPQTALGWGDVARDGKNGVTWVLDEKTIQHPMLRDFQGWQTNPRIDAVRFPRVTRKYWEVEKAPDATAVVKYNDAEKDATRHPAVIERGIPDPKDPKKTKGRVLMLTTRLDVPNSGDPEWHNYWETESSSWHVVFPYLVIRYLAGDTADANFNFLTGQRVAVPLPKGGVPKGQKVLIENPNIVGNDVFLDVGDRQTELSIGPPRTNFPGNFKLSAEAAKWEDGFSLNVPAEESTLDKVPVEAIEDLAGKDAVIPLDRNVNLEDALKGRAHPIDLFPWLLIAVLLLLAVEGLVANRFYRRVR